MSKPDKKGINRRDFLKGLGLAGGTALVSLLGEGGITPVQARTTDETRQGSTPTGIGDSPPLAASFILEVSGLSLQETFEQCTNLGSETDVIEFQDGDDIIMRVRPGSTHYANIILSRDLTANLVMWEWQQMIADGVYARYNGSITALDETYYPIARWDFTNGWPVDVHADLGRSGEGPYLPEMLELTVLTVETLERVAV